MVPVGVNEFGVDGASAPIAEDRGGLLVEGLRRQQLELLHELLEVRVGDAVVTGRDDKVVLDQLR